MPLDNARSSNKPLASNRRLLWRFSTLPLLSTVEKKTGGRVFCGSTDGSFDIVRQVSACIKSLTHFFGCQDTSLGSWEGTVAGALYR